VPEHQTRLRACRPGGDSKAHRLPLEQTPRKSECQTGSQCCSVELVHGASLEVDRETRSGYCPSQGRFAWRYSSREIAPRAQASSSTRVPNGAPRPAEAGRLIAKAQPADASENETLSVFGRRASRVALRTTFAETRLGSRRRRPGRHIASRCRRVVRLRPARGSTARASFPARTLRVAAAGIHRPRIPYQIVEGPDDHVVTPSRGFSIRQPRVARRCFGMALVQQLEQLDASGRKPPCRAGRTVRRSCPSCHARASFGFTSIQVVA
jgi:hypothetical protein